MHTLEPFYRWRELYTTEGDRHSPFYAKKYNDSQCTNKIYNYYIHPRWDEFGSLTLYTKILYIDYKEGYAILEMLGEWNDALYNDIEAFKRSVVDRIIAQGVNKFILICENVLNFHSSDDAYYEEWREDLEEGWICLINSLDHVSEEMADSRLQHYLYFGRQFNDINWRLHSPSFLYNTVNALIFSSQKVLSD